MSAEHGLDLPQLDEGAHRYPVVVGATDELYGPAVSISAKSRRGMCEDRPDEGIQTNRSAIRPRPV
jgi:hypothetical protein